MVGYTTLSQQVDEHTLATVVGGGAPRLWTLPWVEAWRHADTTTPPTARDYQRFITDIAALATGTTPSTTN